MKVVSSDISMMSTREYLEHTEINEELRAWVGDKRPDFGKPGNPTKPNIVGGSSMRDMLELSGLKPENRHIGQYYEHDNIKTSEHTKGIGESFKIEGKEKLKARILERLIEVLTGKKVSIKLVDENDFNCDKSKCENKAANESNAVKNNGIQNPEDRQGWGIEYDYHEKHYESEKSTFTALGVVRTSDGREIEFSVDVSMSREFLEENNISLRAGDAKKIDPLVIDFDGALTELTQTKFAFDLNTDGESENISFVGPDSGFLAIDKNNDGVINNGSELFGPSTGQGFSELAAYDEDGNMWIDESDSIFNQLLVWNKDSRGNDHLTPIAEKGIGAIYLGNIDSQFSIKNQLNQLQGEIDKTGIYLKESGEAGAIRQIDLAA